MDDAGRSVLLYDTTLRDGTQREGISLSVDDKLKIARALDAFGVHYVEGGWPGSNPKDAEFFRRAAAQEWRHAKLAAFGSTRRAGGSCDDDANLRALVDADTPVVTLVGKSSVLHVERVLETTREENLRMVGESVAWLKARGKEVVFDAEHFFDGYREDAEYALAVVGAAAEAGADWLVLCDTNGGSLPQDVAATVAAVRGRTATPLGIHTHDDGALAVANAMAAVQAGCAQVQGTINGYGERCGNMDLVPLLANLQLKLGYRCVSEEGLRHLTELSRFVAAVANQTTDDHAPYVGRSAFAHKGGLHVSGINKVAESYEHVRPAAVGNETRVVVSELAGRQNVRVRAQALGLDTAGRELELVQRIKELESLGLQFEAADGSLEMLIRRHADGYRRPFELLEYRVVDEARSGEWHGSQATVRLRVGDQEVLTVADGDGPVNALDNAIRKALVPHFPRLADVRLVDYKVRIIDEHLGTAARPRVLIECARGEDRWSTVGCSSDVIAASWQALWDALELPLVRAAEGAHAPSEAPRPRRAAGTPA